MGLGAALMLALPTTTVDEARFALTTTGALRITASGDATFGELPASAEVPAAFSITLGAESQRGAVVLMQRAGTTPMAGRYRVRDFAEGDDADFSALFVAGSPSEPIGVFRGRSGTVTITATRPGRVEGTFVIEARGFLASNPRNEDVRVRITGTFVALDGKAGMGV
jgi:hypothetical protein